MRGQPRWCPSSVCLWHSALEAYLQSFESQIAALNDFGVVARQHHQCNCVPVTATSRISSNSMILFLLQGGDYSEKGDAWGVITRTGQWSWWSWWSWVLSEPRTDRLITSRCCLDTSFDDRLQTISRGEMLSAFRCFWIFWIRIILTFTGRGCCNLSLCSADWKPGGHGQVWEEFEFPF